MKREFTQGTIISDIRSEIYPNVRCKGIAISARCDFAQRKISRFYYLSALELEDWIGLVLVNTVLVEKEKEIIDALMTSFKDADMDRETLMGFDNNRISIIVNEVLKDKKCLKKAQENVKRLGEIRELLENKSLENDKLSYVVNNAYKKFEKMLMDLNNSNISRFCFVPCAAYNCKSNNEKIMCGLVVDLQDVHNISMDVCDEILNNKYDYQVIKSKAKRTEINEKFYFESEDDFVMADQVVLSPWIEHVVHMFANNFTRIGVDNLSAENVKEYCRTFKGGV